MLAFTRPHVGGDAVNWQRYCLNGASKAAAINIGWEYTAGCLNVLVGSHVIRGTCMLCVHSQVMMRLVCMNVNRSHAFYHLVFAHVLLCL